MSLFQDTLQNGLHKVSYPLTPEALTSMEAFFDFLLEENQKVNLTAITQPEEAASKHFLDSLAPLWLQLIPQNAAVIDIGAGAGFPSLPLKIARPDIFLTLLDSARKRTGFLEAAVQKLGLENCTIMWNRAEDGARLTNFRAQFDIAVARAVAALPVLLEYTLPFVKVGGLCLLYKGPSAPEEVAASARALQTLGGKVSQVYPCGIDGIQHFIVAVQKTLPTPARYPRKSGTPNRSPL
ncbi:MAG: 16S rRNA (guanine(527)-N(7))-methyltransferase RsmG [Christensenellales bacterium]|jgi:16S rRNA (guanine527-N7)-methyltransferase